MEHVVITCGPEMDVRRCSLGHFGNCYPAQLKAPKDITGHRPVPSELKRVVVTSRRTVRYPIHQSVEATSCPGEY